jgi:AAA family ATP:ADP antiporter
MSSGTLIKRNSAFLFFLMFSIVCLLNVDYAILRSARNALVVADLGKGAESVPIFELFGTMPASFLMVYLLTRLLNRFSIHKVFLITLQTFSIFFLLFAVLIYPSLPTWGEKLSACSYLPFSSYFAIFLPQLFSMAFFVMAELWKIALLTVLFWGLINQYIPISDAKKYYAPLMLGGSVGTVLAGPIIAFCTSDFASYKSWSNSLTLMMFILTLISILIGLFYSALWKHLSKLISLDKSPKEKQKLSVWESIQACINSRYLLLLGWITIADYIAYAVGETIFLDVLKQKFPDPRDYCDYMGLISSWSGIFTAISAIFITPYLLKKCHWVVAAIVTPACILITEGIFFFTHLSSGSLELVVFAGAAFFCLSRAAKSTLFDSSKEISFLLLPSLEKMQGKLIVDGMCSRVGRGGASLVSITFAQIFGGVLASAHCAGPLVLIIGISCVLSTIKLGKLIDHKSFKATDSSHGN